MNKTKIEYLTHSWNPIAMRCTPVSEGCAHCWHLAMANRMAGNQMFPPKVRNAYAGKGPPILMRHRLDEPLRCKKPATIGVQFMGDLFCKKVPDTYIRSVFGTIIDCPQHKFSILTKRPGEALNFLRLNPQLGGRFPDNVWLGVSIENQAAADERREYLRQCPAAEKFVSYEPALSPVDWAGWEFVSQIISGGESGPGARPSHPDWHRATRDFCQANGIAYFFKSWGAWAPESHWKDFSMAQRNRKGAIFSFGDKRFPQDQRMYKIGKRAAGRSLDGKEWNEFPKEAQREV